MEGAPRSPLERYGLSPRQRAEVSPLEATVITEGGSIDDGETSDETTTTVGRRQEPPHERGLSSTSPVGIQHA